MSRIVKLEIKGNYWIQWLRYVSGVNLNEHCMKSLLGYNDKRIRRGITLYEDIELDKAPYYYFCGVHAGWAYAKNIHIAWKDSSDGRFVVDNEFVYAEIEGAERIEIDASYIDETNPFANNKLYNTCRNWQFANWLAKTDDSIKKEINKYKQIKLW